MWACFIAMKLYNHDTFRSLQRELRRKRDLRQACFGRNDYRDVPSDWAFTRFLKKLAAPESCEHMREMFDAMVGLSLLCMLGFAFAMARKGEVDNIRAYARAA